MVFITQTELLSVEQAAKALGLRPSTIRSWVLQRKIEYLKIGSRVFISQSVLRDLLAASVVPVLVDTK